MIWNRRMGFAVSGRFSCGYEAEWLPVGVGMPATSGKWLAPCICRTCHQAISANVRAITLKCPKCKAKGGEPYVDPDAGKEEDAYYPSCAASETLLDSQFACTACGETRLTLEFAGMWD